MPAENTFCLSEIENEKTVIRNIIIIVMLIYYKIANDVIVTVFYFFNSS